MTIDELMAELKRMGITPPDGSPRCCLYLQHIRAAFTFFHETLARSREDGGLGEREYAFVKEALQDPILLNMLCEALDFVLCPGLVSHLNVNQAVDFPTYYSTNFLNANYQENLDNFFNVRPVVTQLLERVANNFRNNIKKACERVLVDLSNIQDTFLLEGERIRGLKKIKSSGSDFHKGGQQVLHLTFEVQSVSRAGVLLRPTRDWKLVYKPSDIEIDCLIAGDSQTVNSIHHNFQEKSLFEILNDEILRRKRDDPHSILETLPTYKILPINYTSNQAIQEPYALDIRRAYGYIEFLTQDSYSFLHGYSDYQIKPSQDSDAICQKFYRLIGQLSAIAATFSFTDVHKDNLIVKNYLPYLIDYEMCFTRRVNAITDTYMYGLNISGSVDAHISKEKKYIESIVAADGRLKLAEQDFFYEAQNRLKTRDGVLIEPMQGTNTKHICRGLREMIHVIQYVARDPIPALNTWINRLTTDDRPVLVRYQVLGTTVFNTMRLSFLQQNNLNFQANDYEYSQQLIQWNADRTRDPKFLGLQAAHVMDDIRNGDIPCFYHQLGSLNIIDSQGRKVVVIPPVIGPGFGRNTFFSDSPFIAHVLTQLAQLQDFDAMENRIDTLVSQILGPWGLGAAPNQFAPNANDVFNILH